MCVRSRVPDKTGPAGLQSAALCGAEDKETVDLICGTMDADVNNRA